ncbi:MAG: hypothetical protein ABIJ12_04670 [bacterium]
MKKLISISLVILCLQVTLYAGDSVKSDHFDNLKKQLKEARCIQIEFISSFESSVFDTTDSTKGIAVISQDGRYNIQLGNDLYLYDLEKSYSYSQGSNQVIIEEVADPEMVGKEISFIKNLDDLYVSQQFIKNRIYKLTKKTRNDTSDTPDSLIIYLSENKFFDSLSYYDINEDLNYIYFISQKISDTCDNSLFIPIFPDSVEKVRF